jgi:hypothetical protein
MTVGDFDPFGEAESVGTRTTIGTNEESTSAGLFQMPQRSPILASRLYADSSFIGLVFFVLIVMFETAVAWNAGQEDVRAQGPVTTPPRSPTPDPGRAARRNLRTPAITRRF